MPYYEKSEDWLHQSALLLQARPQTTRVTTSYALRPALRPSKTEKLAAKEARRQRETSSKTTTSKTKTPAAPAPAEPAAATDVTAATKKPSRGHLVLKTFDPHSGVCLKYKTSKAAEVGRLIQMLGQLGRRMAALPVDEAKESADVVMADAAAAAAEEGAAAVSGTATPVIGGQATPAAAAGGAAGGQGGGQGKKKKKGKR
ncbi:signal recognition particle 9 kDa protein-domain-containing protein [Neurospora tetraspora]|uniref:Signal recognition particle 9 kDa protein-domain-containing protein n=1 Tax=Neurospora tetraspora TaxID=94610 RepID=A0AAE0MNZ6_9PEZI|nr:signal recognition particle 9 kDa protein-domain-containing protein [Neurospora tetraspora]